MKKTFNPFSLFGYYVILTVVIHVLVFYSIRFLVSYLDNNAFNQIGIAFDLVICGIIGTLTFLITILVSIYSYLIKRYKKQVAVINKAFIYSTLFITAISIIYFILFYFRV